MFTARTSLTCHLTRHEYEQTLKAAGLVHNMLTEQASFDEEVLANLRKNWRFVSNREYEQCTASDEGY